MSVAALYDIHGNLPALEAVLAEIQADGIDEVVVGGDVVPGPMPREAMAALLDVPVPVHFIRGNGDADVLTFLRGEESTRVPERARDLVHWSAEALTAEQASEMATWPSSLTVPVPDLGDVLFCHATPRDDNEIFTRLTPEARLRPLFEDRGADLVVCGHTHMQFDRRIGEVRVVNAGSVGMPFGAPGAYWLLLTTDVELRHTQYDLDAAHARIQATAYPRASAFDVRHVAAKDHMLAAFEAAALR